jgi:hypothetical protein
MKQGCPPVKMLVLHAFMRHLSPEIHWQFHYTDLIFVPGWMTKQLQVLDVAINRPFKDHLKQQWSEWLLTGDHSLTPVRRIKKSNVPLLCQWLVAVWECNSTELLVWVLKSAKYPLQQMGLMRICCGMTVGRMGMLGVGVRKMKAPAVRNRERHWVMNTI